MRHSAVPLINSSSLARQLGCGWSPFKRVGGRGQGIPQANEAPRADFRMGMAETA